MDRFFLLPSIIGIIIAIVAGNKPAPTAAKTAELDGTLLIVLRIGRRFIIMPELMMLELPLFSISYSFWLCSTVLKVRSTSKSPPCDVVVLVPFIDGSTVSLTYCTIRGFFITQLHSIFIRQEDLR
jgi:hypothetical protein